MKKLALLAAFGMFGLFGGNPTALAQHRHSHEDHEFRRRGGDRFGQPLPFYRQNAYAPPRVSQPPLPPIASPYPHAQASAETRHYVYFRKCIRDPWQRCNIAYTCEVGAAARARFWQCQGYLTRIACAPQACLEFHVMIRKCPTDPWTHYSNACYFKRCDAGTAEASLRARGYLTRMVSFGH